MGYGQYDYIHRVLRVRNWHPDLSGQYRDQPQARGIGRIESLGCGHAGMVDSFAAACACPRPNSFSPAYNFAVIPVIASRHPLWEDRLEEDTGRTSLTEGYLLTEGRETMGTSPIDAKPMTILKMPDDSYMPFFVGLFVSLLFVGLLLHWWNFAGAMAVLGCIALITWMWPRKTLVQRVFSTARTSRRAP